MYRLTMYGNISLTDGPFIPSSKDYVTVEWFCKLEGPVLGRDCGWRMLSINTDQKGGK